ncbi:MAG: hypothetical protein QW279_10215 [Candidatus Jordarchaeaceae archaeon]
MLEKYLGWLVGTSLLILFSIAIFPTSFQLVINWFGPVVGQPLMPILILVFILIAPATKYQTVLTAYIVSGFACGAVGRGGIKRSVILAILVFLTLFLILGANIYSMIKIFGSLESMSLPNPPSDASVVNLLSLPLVSDYLSSVLENLFSRPSGGMDILMLNILSMILINLIINFIALCISSILGGLATSKLFPRLRKKKALSTQSTFNQRILALSVISLTLFVQSPFTSCNIIKGFGGVSKGSLVSQDLGVLEMLKGDFLWTIIQNDGSLSLICGYGSSDPASIGVSLSNNDLQGIIFAGFLVRSGELTMPEDIPQQLQQFLPFIPTQGFVVVSLDSESEARIQTVVSRFETALGIHFKKSMTLQIPIEDRKLNIAFYNVPEGMTVEDSYESFRSMIPENSVFALISPEKVVSKPFVAIIGIINLEMMSELGFEIEDGLLVLALNYVEWSRNFFTGTSTFALSLQEALGFTGSISSNLPNGSYLVVSTPKTVNVGSLNVNPEKAEIHDNTVVLKVNPGETYSDFQIGFAARFPPNVIVTKNVSPSTTSVDGTVTVTVTIKNLGDTVINNVRLNDSETLMSYRLTAYIVSGQTYGYWTKLEPNETQTISYVVKVTSNGIYTLTPARVIYSSEYGEQQKLSEKAVITSNFSFGNYLIKLFTDQTFIINPFILVFILAIIIPPIVEAIKTLTRKKRSIPPSISDTEQIA